MARIVSIIAGVVAGASLAGLGLLLGSSSEPGETPAGFEVRTTTIAPIESTLAEPPWTDEGGVRFESTVIVVDDLSVEGDSAVLDYRLLSRVFWFCS